MKLSIILFLVFQGTQSLGQGGPYGISSPTAIDKFLDGALPAFTPSTNSTTVSSWDVVNAFPNLNFRDPLEMREYPGTNKFLIAGKTGEVRVFENNPNASSSTLFLDISSRVRVRGDCGFLGLIFHPEFGQAGSPNKEYVYVYYRYTPNKSRSDQNAYCRLSRFTVPEGTFQADPQSEYVLIQQFDRSDFHNGGSMFFGPQDGFLYLSVGDEGGSADVFNSAQKLDGGFFSGIFRIDVDRRGGSTSHPIIRQPLSGGNPPSGWEGSYSQGYYIPNDNPFVNPNGSVLEEYWALGLRSPHRMWYDQPTGDIWVGDVGQGIREEVTIMRKADNAQWPDWEGRHNRGAAGPPNPIYGNYKAPVIDYPRSDGSSIIGGIVYRGAKWASSLGGKYIFSDNVVQTIWTLDYYNSGSTQKEVIATIPFNTNRNKDGVSHIYTDQEGEVYLLQLSGNNHPEGSIYKLVPDSETSNPVSAPNRLSQTGAFSSLSTLSPSPGVVPYEPNVTFWSDGTEKKRWIALPNDGTHNSGGEQIVFSENGEWEFPNGTVFIKHFDMPIDDRNPGLTKKIETRFIVKGDDGIYYFLTYRWRENENEADLVSSAQNRTITIQTDNGTRQQVWRYPSTNECITCHNTSSKQVLGFNTRQLNGDLLYPSSGNTDNQLRTLNHLNWFSPSLNENSLSSYLALHPADATSETIEDRARSFLDVNCAYCHRPGGLENNYDWRYTTPLVNQDLILGDVGNTLGIAGAKLIVPGDTSKSIVYQRLKVLDEGVVMPPLAKNKIDEVGKNLIAEWILSLAPNDEEPPSIPTGLLATDIQQTQVTLTWNPSTDNDVVTGYRIFQDGNNEAYTTSNTTFTVTGLSPETIYFFAVAAEDASDNVSDQSPSIQVQTLAPIDPCVGQPDVTIDPAGPYTTDQGIQQLTADPTGGTWSGSANADGTFDPSQGAGTYQVTYTVDFGNGCIKSIDADIEVNDPVDPCAGQPAVTIDPAGPFTTDESIQQLTGNPSGGTWSGSANGDGTFDLSQGAGTYQVTYTVDFGNGCIKSVDANIEVTEPTDPCAGQPAVTIDPAGPFTTDEGIQQLTANPSGGTWSGSANADGTFDPSQGAGTYQVTYTVDFGNGCVKSIDADIEVNDPVDPCAGQPDVTIDPAGPYTTDEGIQQLTADPTGGTWSGSANADGTFDPSQGAGTYQVTYTVDFGNGCIKSVDADIEVIEPIDPCAGQPDVTIDPAGPYTTDEGIQQLTANPSGGTWSGSANADGTFDPSQGAGTYTVSYTVDFGDGCVKSTDASITVSDPPSGECTVPYNLALNQPSSQSSTNGDGVASFTNDGNTVGDNFSGADANLSHTAFGDNQPWWKVDLGSISTLDRAVLYNRNTSNSNHLRRLKNFYLYFSDSDIDGERSHSSLKNDGSIEWVYFSGELGTDATIQLNDIQARHMTLKLVGNGPLHIAELELYGCPGEGGPVDPCLGQPDVTINPAGPFTTDQGIQQLSANPSGGTWSGAANADGTFDPSQGAGSYTVTYTVDLGNGCIKPTDASIEVTSPSDPCAGQPDVTIDPAGPFTTDQGIQQLTGNPSGGTWSGSANADGTFDPSQGAGTYTVSYTVDFGNGCVKSTDATIDVTDPSDPCAGQPAVTINPAGPFTSDQGVQQLSGNPTGGTWSGSANADGTFDPSQGAGAYTVTYTVDFGAGCVKSTDASITVSDPPSGECTVPYNLALNQPSSQSSTNGDGVASFTNDGNPVGDNFSGATANLSHTEFGDNQPWWKVDLGSKSTLDRAVLYNRNTSNSNHLRRLRNFYLYFSDSDIDGERSHSSLKNDGAIEWVQFSGEVGTDETIQLNDIQARHVLIKLVGNGPLHMAEVEIYGCPGEGGPVDPCIGQPDVTINPAGPFTTDQGIQQLTANPSGGTWSGAANSNGTFDPSQGAGSYTVTYTVDFGDGCIKSDDLTLTVTAPGDPCAGQPEVTISPAGPFTTDQGIQQLTANPSGGVWSGAANADGTFDPSQGAGSYTVTYMVDFGDGCIKSDDLSITVNTPSTGECSTPFNMALNQPASQSSTNADGVASFTNDGNTVGDDFSGADANLSHTGFGDNQPWWKVDLGTLASLDRAVLYNRNTSNNKHLARLKNFYLYFSDSDMDGERSHSSLKNDAAIEWIYFSGELGTNATIQLNNIEARQVMIKLLGNGPLHIAEFEIYGCPVGGATTRFAETAVIAPGQAIEEREAQIELIPNPTDRQTGLKVWLRIPQSEFVVLELYSVEGKLLQRQLQEGEIRETKFSLSLLGLPSGTYLIRSYGNGWELNRRLSIK